MRDLKNGILAQCLKQQGDRLLIKVEVKPGSMNTEIKGVDEWRLCIEIAVRERAKGGAANIELVQFLSSVLSLSSNQIIIVKGQKTRKKIISISGLTEDGFILALEKEIEKVKTDS